MYNQKINNTLHRNKKKYLSSLGMIVTLLILSITTEGLFIVLAIIDSRRVMIPFWIMIIILLFIFYLILAAIFLGYPELSDNELIIRNALHVSYKKRFAYNDIRKVEICHGGFHYPCLRIYSNTFQHPILYGIECMSQDSISGFSADLSEKGVEVIRLLD